MVAPEQAPTRTTELRWFFDGRLPGDVRSWFTHDGECGLQTSRRDSYLIDGQEDVGVKRRRGTLLELKQRGRRSPYRHREMEGWIEEWQRWSPADDLVDLADDAVWMSIDKEILKRRFRTTGPEVPLTLETRAMSGVGCDAEVAALSVDGQPSWTFALSAFGSAGDHPALLDIAWDCLVAERPGPPGLRLTTTDSCGYAERMTTST
jgi:hypothetical protein